MGPRVASPVTQGGGGVQGGDTPPAPPPTARGHFNSTSQWGGRCPFLDPKPRPWDMMSLTELLPPPPLQAHHPLRPRGALIPSIEGQAILTTLNLTLMADALSTTSDISHCDTDSWSAENSDCASQLSSRTCSTEGSRD